MLMNLTKGSRQWLPFVIESLFHYDRINFCPSFAVYISKQIVMKKLLMITIAIGLALGVSAQKVVGRGGGYHVGRPRVSVGLGWGYSPFYSPGDMAFTRPGCILLMPNYGSSRPSRLDLTVQDIKSDYNDRIKSVRMQDDLTGREKRQTIRQLRDDRDKAVVQRKRITITNGQGRTGPPTIVITTATTTTKTTTITATVSKYSLVSSPP